VAKAVILALALCVAGAAFAQAPAPAAAQADPAKSAAKTAKAAPKQRASKVPGRPSWAELNAEHQRVLEPLKPGWDELDAARKKKWIGIAKRYPKMKPEAQARVQKRMQIWANLSPEQRRQARDNYREAAKASRVRHKDLRQQWAEYQSLSPVERERLVAEPVPAKTSKKKK
jgi:hypothetical protein